MGRKSIYSNEEGEEGRVERERESFRRYRQSEKGRITVKRVNGGSPAREARKKYSKSPKGRLARARYRNSDIGKASRSRYQEKLQLAGLIVKREEQGLCGLCGGGEHKSEEHLSRVSSDEKS